MLRFLAVFLCVWSGSDLRAAVPNSDNSRRVQFREPHPTRYLLLEDVATNQPVLAGEHWTRVRREGGSTHFIELGSRVVLQLAPGRDLNSLLTHQPLVLSRVVRSNLFILQAPDSKTAMVSAQDLATADGVEASYPVMRRSHRTHDTYLPAPNDSYFGEQWHLENRGADGR